MGLLFASSPVHRGVPLLSFLSRFSISASCYIMMMMIKSNLLLSFFFASRCSSFVLFVTLLHQCMMLNNDFLSYIFSVSENTKTIHLIMMIWLFSFIISSYKIVSSPPQDPGGSKKILSKSGYDS